MTPFNGPPDMNTPIDGIREAIEESYRKSLANNQFYFAAPSPERKPQLVQMAMNVVRRHVKEIRQFRAEHKLPRHVKIMVEIWPDDAELAIFMMEPTIKGMIENLANVEVSLWGEFCLVGTER